LHKDVFGQEAKLVPQLGGGAPALQHVPSVFAELWGQICGGNIIVSCYALWRYFKRWSYLATNFIF